MADLTDIQAAQSVKIIGSSVTGVESTPVASKLNNTIESLVVYPNTAITTPSNTRPTVTTTSSIILASNVNRKYVILTNNAIKTIWIKLGATAVASEGIALPAGGAFEILATNLWIGDIHAIISAGAAVNLDIFEGT